MAYFIFLKYLDSIEDFRKNPHVKIPPKSHCANFQTLDIFKNSIFNQKRFCFNFQPNRPSGQPAIFFLLLHRSRARKPPPPAGLVPPPSSAPTTSTGGKITTASLLLHFPTKRHPSPSSIHDNRCLQSGGIEAPSTPAIEGTRPPPPRLRPIKGRPALGEDPHTSSAPSLRPHRALAATLPSRVSTVGETPLHRLPTCGDPVVELAFPSFPSPTHWSELSGTGAVGG
jgi:hypothetical protein